MEEGGHGEREEDQETEGQEGDLYFFGAGASEGSGGVLVSFVKGVLSHGGILFTTDWIGEGDRGAVRR